MAGSSQNAREGRATGVAHFVVGLVVAAVLHELLFGDGGFDLLGVVTYTGLMLAVLAFLWLVRHYWPTPLR